MLRKITYFLFIFSMWDSVSFASPAFNSYINYYLGPKYRERTDNYAHGDLPTFDFQPEDMNKLGKLIVLCHGESGKCVVASVWGAKGTIFFKDNYWLDKIRQSGIPGTGYMNFARVTDSAWNMLHAKADYGYSWGADKKVDEEWFSCGIATGACLTTIATTGGVGLFFGSIFACLASVDQCVKARRTTFDYEAEMRAAREAKGEKQGGSAAENRNTPSDATTHEIMDLQPRELPQGHTIITEPSPATGGGIGFWRDQN